MKRLSVRWARTLTAWLLSASPFDMQSNRGLPLIHLVIVIPFPISLRLTLIGCEPLHFVPSACFAFWRERIGRKSNSLFFPLLLSLTSPGYSSGSGPGYFSGYFPGYSSSYFPGYSSSYYILFLSLIFLSLISYWLIFTIFSSLIF